jgi:hypothetical protein
MRFWDRKWNGVGWCDLCTEFHEYCQLIKKYSNLEKCMLHMYHSLDPDHTTSISFGLQPERGRNRHGKGVATKDLMKLPEGLKSTNMTS